MRAAITLALVLVAGACRHDLGTLAVVDPASPTITRGPRVSGSDCAHWLLGFPIGAPDIGAASRSALAHSGGTHLIDVRVRESFWTAFAYGRRCLIVDGVAR